ncbi:MAG: PilZ domain-containing protein [Candidatus Omnitrophota bacterium]|nr:PilZ domain-containing protein [Candidatus Omnitrophota bacterium]
MQDNLGEVEQERRKFVRLDISCNVNYKILDEKPIIQDKSQTKNISAGGICLIVDEELKPGTSLDLDFELPDKKTPIKAKGMVVWIKPFKIASEQQHFDSGIEFTQISPTERKRIDQYVFRFK